MNAIVPRAVTLAALLLSTAFVRATEVSVALRSHSQTATLAGESTLRVIAPDGRVQLERTVDATKNVVLDLPAGHWQLELVDARWWHDATFVHVGLEPALATLTLWPAGFITGAIDTKERITNVRLRFQSAADDPEFPSAEVPCTVTERQYSCKVAAGKLDLRVRAPGYIPRYFWDRTAADEPSSLGTIAFEKGASLTGSVVVGRGVDLGANDVITVVAAPVNASPQSTLARFAARAGKRGHFNFDGLPPGDYVVQAIARTAQSDELHIVVLAGTVAAMTEPLRLDVATAVNVQVTPPLDPWGKPWQLTLTRSAGDDEIEIAAKNSASESGEWTSPATRNGLYTLDVSSHQGGVWASRELELPADSGRIAIVVPANRVRGTVTLGDRPLEAKVEFRADAASVHIAVTSDREGAFDTYLPRAGEQPWRVEVSSEDPRVKRLFSDVVLRQELDAEGFTAELKVPLTTLSGFVYEPGGEAAPDAIINVMSESGEYLQGTAREDGYFAIHGLATGRHRVQAAAYLTLSNILEVEVTDELTPDPVHLALRPEEKVRGWVTSAVAPVAGAEVVIEATDVAQQLIWAERTDVRGEFAGTAPPGAREVDVAVYAPGFDYRLMHMRLQREPVNIRVSQNGGMIVVPLIDGPLQPYLQHAGALGYAGVVQMTSLPVMKRETRGTPELVLGPMAPGPYSFCLVMPAQIAMLRQGTLDRSAHCLEGYLPPHGELRFATPRIAARTNPARQ